MRAVNSTTQVLDTIRHTLGKNKLLTVLFFVGLVTSFVIAKYYKSPIFDVWLDPFSGVMTLLVAITIALQNYIVAWRNSLPKTLTVHYMHDGKYYLSCYYADLTSEGDIRMWAQQIGSQMVENRHLSFNPYFDLEGPEIMELKPNSQKVLHYQLTILLKDLNLKSGKNTVGQLENHKRWIVIHGEDNKVDHKIELELLPASGDLPEIDLNRILLDRQNSPVA